MAASKSMASLSVLVLVLIALIAPSRSLYEDQIGKYDWHRTQIGKPIHVAFESVKRIIVATERNVLASLNLKNGNVVWRQPLEHGYRIELLEVDGEIVTVNGNGEVFYVRGWDPNNGMLTFEWSLTLERKPNVKWVTNGEHLINIVAVPNSHLEVTTYQLKTGANKGNTARISTEWIGDLSRCVLSEHFYVCLSDEKIIYLNLLTDLSRVQSYPLRNLMGDTSGEIEIKPFKHSKPSVLLKRNRVNRVVSLGEKPEILPFSLEDNVISAPNGEENVLIELKVELSGSDRNINLNTIDLQTDEKNSILVNDLLEGAPVMLKAGICRGQNCRILYVGVDDTIKLMQSNGKTQWAREEALADVIAAEFIDLPLSDLEISIEKEFNEASSDVISQFVRRIVSQTKQIVTFVSGTENTSKNHLVRDDFGLHKLIILATKVGKLFAIDTITGEIVWSKYLHGIAPFDILGTETMYLVLQRTARYAPLGAEMTLIARNAAYGAGIVYRFDPITGKSLTGIRVTGHEYKQIMLLPYEDENHVKPIVILTGENEILVLPEEAKVLLRAHRSELFMFNADAEVITGYNLHFGDRATPTWSLNFAPATLVALTVRPSTERVHSQGRVLADRSVFYKYVNPNLIAVATLSNDVLHKHVLSVYLIDGVTGLIVYSAHHKRANAPVHMVHSENWVVYSYFSERFRRFEMNSVALYEGARQSNSSAFSSHSLSSVPHPEVSSCIFPATPTTMISTLTERGITNKHLLVGLSKGDVLEVPWSFVEPRLPQLPDEGNMPYLPELPIITENIINYNQSLGYVKGIQVSPARLESTSLVIVYGLDLFYTRVMPSKTFDVLKEDFDHWLIIMVLTGLTLASYVTKKLSIRKALKQQWK